jgi:hypothetical protein
MDGRYLKSVHKQLGELKKIKSFPVMSMTKLIYYVFVKGIKEVRLMEYINYVKKDVDSVLGKELSWKYYGGHHHENNFTKFFQSYYLPQRFGIDKRKTELSAMIRSAQTSREKALSEIQEHPYHYEKQVVEYVINKLGLTEKEFDTIMNAPIKSHDDYPTYLPIIKSLKYPIKVAVSLHLLPQILYLKYAR